MTWERFNKDEDGDINDWAYIATSLNLHAVEKGTEMALHDIMLTIHNSMNVMADEATTILLIKSN